MEFELDMVLHTATSEAEAGMISELLRDEGITNFTRTRGAGVVYVGAATGGVDICVGEADYPRAKELLDAYFAAPVDWDSVNWENGEENGGCEEDKDGENSGNGEV